MFVRARRPRMSRATLAIIVATFAPVLGGEPAAVRGQSPAGEHKVAVLAPLPGPAPVVDQRFNKRGLKYVYRTEIDATGFGWYNVEFIAKHLAPRLNLKPNQLKVAFLSEDSSYGQGVTESARQRAKTEFGMQEVMLEYYNWQTLNDMTPTILKMKQLNPDVVHHIGFGNDAVLFWRQSKEQNFLFKALVHAGATGYGGGDFGKALGSG